MSEATLDTPAVEEVTTPAPEAVIETPLGGGSPLGGAEGEVSTPVEEPVAAGDPAPSAAPEPPRQRTLNDVYEDIRQNKPVPPAEYEAVRQYEARIENDRKAREAEDERIANLFPTQRKELLGRLAAYMGVTSLDTTEGLALQKIVDDHFSPLEKDARSTFTTPILRTFGGQLWEQLGRTQEAHKIIQGLSPQDVVPFAIELGKRMGMTPPDMADTDSVTKWVDGGKLDAKKLITVADAEKRIEKALDVERRANPDRVAPGPTGARARPVSQMSLDQIEREPTDVWMARPKEERDLLLRQAHEAATRGTR